MKTIPKTFKVKLSQTLVRSENCYKGAFETIEALMQVVAFEGDYADCYETDSRWTFINDAWTNTHQPIPEDPRYALESDVSKAVAPNTIAKRDDSGSLSVAAPTSTLHATNKEYVDDAVEELHQQITEHDEAVSQSIEQLRSDLDDEITRATDAEQALQQSINEKLSMQSATTSLPQAYIKQANGNQSMQDIDTAQTPNTLALRDGSGRLKTSAPTDDNDAATKHYVDAAVEQIDAEAIALQNALNNEISRATAAEEANAQAIANETSAREQAVNTINTTLSELQSGKLDKTFANAVITNIAYSYNQADDSSTLVVSVVDPSNKQASTINITLPKATASQPGLMTKESVTALSQLISRVSALEGKQFRYLYTTSANPTADDINTFVLAQGEVAPFSGVEVIVEATKHIWRYYQNDNIGWRDDGIDTVSIASQTQIGVVQGSTENGKVFVENDGTMSMNGYDALVNADSTNAQAISAETTRAQQAEQTNAEAAQSALTAANAKYTKPATGIPETDLSSDVQMKLNASGGTTVEANPTDAATQDIEKIKIDGMTYSIPKGVNVVDIGTVTLIAADGVYTKEVTLTTEQAQALSADIPPVLRFTAAGMGDKDGKYELSRARVMDLEGDTQGYLYSAVSQTEQDNPVTIQGLASGTRAQIIVMENRIVDVVANPTEEATQTLEKLKVGNKVYSIPQGAKVVDGGTLTLSGTGTSEVTLSPDVVAQLVAEDVIGAKFDVAGVDVLFNRTIYNPAAGSVSYTTAVFECITLALTGSTVTSIAVGVNSNSTTASVTVTDISSGGTGGGTGGGSVTKNSVLQALGINETQLNTLIALLGKTSVNDSTGVTFSAPVNTTQYFNVNEQ